MDSTDDLTDRILREIRDGIGKTLDRLDHTHEQIDRTVVRLDLACEHVERRVAESEIRVCAAMNEFAREIRGFRRRLVPGLDLRERVEDCERRIHALEQS